MMLKKIKKNTFILINFIKFHSQKIKKILLKFNKLKNVLS